MKKNSECRSIKKVLNIALIFQIIYLVSICLVNFIPNPFVQLFIYPLREEYKTFIDLPYFVGAIITTMFFIILYIVFSKKIDSDKNLSTGFNFLVGAYSFIFYITIPEATNVISSIQLSRKEISESTFAAMKGLGTTENFMKIWLFIATVLLVCAYSMYWSKKKYCLETSE